MYCQNCANELNDQAVACPKCGTPVQSKSAAPQDEKTIAIIAYIPIAILGLVVALVMHNSNKTKFGAYHLRQSLGLNCTFLALYILMMMLSSGSPLFVYKYYNIFMLVGLAFLALFIMGIVNSVNGEQKPLPVVGKLYEKWFEKLFN